MSVGKIGVNILAYEDAAQGNDPKQMDFNWTQEWVETMETADVVNLSLEEGSHTVAIKDDTLWLFILADQAVKASINAGTGIDIVPTAAGAMSGIMLLRGEIASLSIVVPALAEGDVARVKIFSSN